MQDKTKKHGQSDFSAVFGDESNFIRSGFSSCGNVVKVVDRENVETIGRDTTLIIRHPNVEVQESFEDPEDEEIPEEEQSAFAQEVAEELGEEADDTKMEGIDIPQQSVQQAKTFRAIVDADYGVEPGDTVKFTVKPHKMHIFNKETGELV